MLTTLTRMFSLLLIAVILPLPAFAERQVVANPHKDAPRKNISVEEKLAAAEARKSVADPSYKPRKNKKAKQLEKAKQKKDSGNSHELK